MTDDYVIHSEEEAGFVLRILPDPEPADPRAEWDNAATMACKHPRYDFGDKDGIGDLHRAIEQSPHYRRAWNELDAIEMIVTALPHCRDIVALPLSIYDHSGVTLWAGPPRHAFDPGGWDTSQVGFIFMTKSGVLANWGLPDTARLTASRREQAFALMRAEVETYDAYLTGQVCGYVVADAQGAPLDSCWGFYTEQDAIDAGRNALAWHAANPGARPRGDCALAR